MAQLILRADDYGYSEGVNLGIIKCVKEGVLETVGIMTNMEKASFEIDFLKNADICLGQHTNISAGKPLTDPGLIPSLVDNNGLFHSSKFFRTAKHDPVSFDEALLELEAQYRQFIKMTGRKPDYIDGHAVKSENYFRALEQLAKQFGLNYFENGMHHTPVSFCGWQVYVTMESMNKDYCPEETLKRTVLNAHPGEHDCELMILHPGYLDYDIIRQSSLTIPRTQEVEMLCSREIAQWLSENQVELLTLSDLTSQKE